MHGSVETRDFYVFLFSKRTDELLLEGREESGA
jgi:hypothetical protein